MDSLSRKNIIEYNKNRQLTKKPDLIGPDGTVYADIFNLTKFAKEHNIDPSTLYKVVKGKLKSIKGYRLK